MSVRELIWKLQAEGAGEFASDIKDADKVVDGLKNNITSVSGGVESQLKNIGGKVSKFGKGMTKGGAVMTAATLPLTMKLKQGVEDARELDNSIRKVTTLADAEILPMEQIRKATKRISNEAGIAQSEIAEGMYEALSSGISTDEVVGFAEQALKLTRAGFTDLPTVIDATTTALNAYGSEAMSTAKIQDIFVMTQDKGKIEVDELASNIGRVIPIAAAANVNIDQLGASYSILTAKGQNARIATTNLNGLLAELSTTGSKSDKVIREVAGKSFQELMNEGKNLGEVLEILQVQAENSGLTLGDMFGNQSAVVAANTLLSDGANAYTEMLDVMQNSDGAVNTNFEKMMGDMLAYEQSTERMRNAWMDMGVAIAPIVTRIMTKIGELAMKFQELTPAQQSAIATLAGILVVAGPLLGIIGMLGMGIGGLISFFGILAGPAGLVIGIFSLLAAAGIALYTNWDTIKAKGAELAGMLQGKLQGAANAVSNGFQSMRAKVNSALESIKQKWEAVKAFFAKPIKGVINVVGGAIGGIANKVKGLVPHKTGLDRVPYDNYGASLHKDEMVLTKEASEQYRSLGGSKDGLSFRRLGSTQSSVTNNSPIININVYGNADRKTVDDIGNRVREEVSKIFRELQLQRA